MNISSLRYWNVYNTQQTSTNNTATTPTTDTAAALLGTEDASSTAGDTFTYASQFAGLSAYTQYAPPPPRPIDETNASRGSEVRDFLDKVKNGSVTNDDVSNMQSLLQQNSLNTTTTNTNSSDLFGSFLNKVASGTVTDSDLTTMQSKLQALGQHKAHGGHGHHGLRAAAQTSDDSTVSSDDVFNTTLQTFLGKVASGSVTDNDLSSMQTTLQAHQNQGPPPPPPPEQSGTATDSGDNNNADSLKKFLDKVADGSVSSSDLSDMQALLQYLKSNTSQTR